MGKNTKIIFSKFWLLIISLSIFITVTGCNRKEEVPDTTAEKISSFSFQSLGEKVKFQLVGESAEIKKSKGKSEIKKPSISLEFEDQIIEIKTGPEGKAEIEISQKGQKIEKAILTGNITVIQKNQKNKQITLEAYCRKLTYVDKAGLLIMEGNPLVKREKSKFSGEKILYYWQSNKLEVRGKVNVIIYPEKTSGD